MTDYSTYSSKKKKKKLRRKNRRIILIGLTVIVVLVFALFTGLFKNFSVGSYFGKSKWDSKSTFSAVLNTNPLSIVSIQKDPKLLVMFSLNEDLNFKTGDISKPVDKVSNIINREDGRELTGLVSSMTRTPINNYFILEENENANEETINKFFESSASLVSPLRILTSNFKNVKETNVTRIDQIRLWWQLKSFDINDVKFVDLSSASSEIVLSDNEKVLGIDDQLLHRKLSKYFENRFLLEERGSIEVENASGVFSAGQMAADFITSVGGKVDNVSFSERSSERTKIVTGNDDLYTSKYLAKVFECDINVVSSTEEGKVKIVIGRDFADKYIF